MDQPLLRYLQLNAVSHSADERSFDIFKPIKHKKNAILHRAGEICNKLYFINKGCIRTYYLTEEGLDKTRFIATEGMFAGALASFISGQSAFEFVAAVEDCELLCITRAEFYDLVKNYPEWQRCYTNLLEMAYLHQNKRIGERITLSAKERFDMLMNEHPEYFNRISNKILASYLDISQETLSRLKSK